MRSFARLLALLLVLAPAAHAQTSSSQAKKLYDEALRRERIVRQDLQRAKTPEAQAAVLRKVRTLSGTYEDISRLFPTSDYADDALWQGAALAADAFWEFGEGTDRTTALRLFSALTSRFPSSSFAPKVSSHTRRLQDARATTPTSAAPPTTPSSSEPPTTPSSSAAPTSSSLARPRTSSSPARRASTPASTNPASNLAALPAPLTSITREVLPEVLRFVIQVGREVTFYDERIDGPPRVYLDLHNTRVVESLRDKALSFPDDLVKQVRIGRQPNSRTRVVLDLIQTDARYSVYTLYDPYRIVVDFERERGITPAPDATLAATNAAASAPPDARPAAVVEQPAPASEVPVVATAATESAARPLDPEPPPPAPLPPSTNVSGGFSLSRQLGLGATRIVVDAGHGGHDPGAKARGIEEAALVLDVALRLEALLKDAGFEVIMTRRTDTFVPLEERTAIANRAEADLFLSIHANASATEAARGVETYFLNFATNPQAEAIAARENAGGSQTMRNLPDIVRAIALNNKIDESRDFASMVQNALYTRLRKTNRNVRNLGVKQAPFVVLVGATMPSILAEISFITNRQEAALLKTDRYKQQIAEALLAGVLKYQQALKKVPAIAATK